MKSSIKRRKRAKVILTNGIMILIMLFYLLPFWYVINNAFKEKSYISLQPFTIRPEIFTFDSIISAFEKMNYTTTFLNSLIVLVLSCTIFVIVGSMTAYGICISGNKWLNYLYVFFVSLIALPFQAAMVPLVSLLKNLGLSDSYLGLALVYSAMFMPFIVFLYTGFMRSLPMEIMESARIDGCSYFQAYVHIYMPLLKTITGIVLVLRGVYVWNDLQVPLIVINDPAKQTLQQRLYVFAQSRIGNFDLVFAGALIVCLPMVILFLLMQKSFIKGVMAGSIKG
ncbi:carbohydrate ABC transporter permease [Youxingia wuxianensis]|uniref:Carbohydrate ABC transporter permease n=1 Tax=Youxingia wuxianensis TaxID=2763678 RepID=A0A926EL26_9FIRM|nr:carbohydrate ABC transporter permease [Youxingia wuxianensis]MBC8585363.1 carbohydrate ABC transporter permease [Youxingia wuxianensis]